MNRQPIDARSGETACGLDPKGESGGDAKRQAQNTGTVDLEKRLEALLVEELVTQLRSEAERQRNNRGDMMDHGHPDPWLTQAADTISAQSARVTELEKALAPFKWALEEWGDDPSQRDQWEIWKHPLSMNITIGHIRGAASLLSYREYRTALEARPAMPGANIVDRSRSIIVQVIRDAAHKFAPGEGSSYEYLAGIAAKIEAAEAVPVDSYLVLDCVIAALKVAAPAIPEREALRPEVLAFAQLMERQLRANDHKPGWKNDTPQALWRRINQETHELGNEVVAVERIDPAKAGKEAADVANFAMMVADVCGALPTTGDVREAAPEREGVREIVPTANIAAWLGAVAQGEWTWISNPPCKYVSLHIDTRHGAYKIEDRDGNPISFAEVLRQGTSSISLTGDAREAAPGAHPGDIVTVNVRRCGDYSGEHREWEEQVKGVLVSMDKLASPPSAHDMREAVTRYRTMAKALFRSGMTNGALYLDEAASTIEALASSPMDAVKAAVEAEREACAKVAADCAVRADRVEMINAFGVEAAQHAVVLCEGIAQAIRARAGGAK